MPFVKNVKILHSILGIEMEAYITKGGK